MSEQNQLTPGAEEALDRLLKQSFDPGQSLSEEFDSRVMASIRAQKSKSDGARKVMVVMMIYWAVASLTGAWFLADSLPAAMRLGSLMLPVFIPMVIVMALSILYLARQSRIRLSDLFLGTFQ